MIRLILKLGLYAAICMAILSFVLIRYGGNIDFFYNKFTSPKAKSMIIGDSRSLQGIQPKVMNAYFAGEGYSLPVLNYSFTIAQAIIGPLYNTSILKKLDTTAQNGIFIISLTPEMLTSKKGVDHSKGDYREAGQPPHNMDFVTMNPNFEYVAKNLSFFHFRGAFSKNVTLHKDGWLEETNLPANKAVFDTWKNIQMNEFLKERAQFYISETRIESLDVLIKKLRMYGNVFLIRMPISKEFLSLENKYYPQFDRIADSVSQANGIAYIDFNTQEKELYKTYDGHHIDKFAGKEFTRALCDSIQKSIKRRKNSK